MPEATWTQTLGIPSFLVPYGAPEQANHSPNESYRIDRRWRGIATSAALLSALTYHVHWRDSRSGQYQRRGHRQLSHFASPTRPFGRRGTSAYQRPRGSARSSLWWLQFGLACCGIEMISAQISRRDMSERFGKLQRASRRHAGLMIVAGIVSTKMAPTVRTRYDQIPEPKWVLSMGSCANVGGPYDTYAVVQGVDLLIPVDVYVPGCPPTLEVLHYGVLTSQNKVIKHETKARKHGVATAEGQRRGERDDARIAIASIS